MHIASKQWKHFLVQNAESLGVIVTHQQVEQFARHAVLLMEWNRTVNLTTIRDPKALAVKHYLDSIAPLAHIPEDGPLIDVGTGGGFPGIPLKIMRPNQPMILIDSVRKKISFVKHCIRHLGLKRIQAIQARAEALCHRADYAGLFRGVLCRAVTDPKNVIPRFSALLAEEGRILIYLGPNDDYFRKTSHSSPGTIGYHFKIMDYSLPIQGGRRRVAILRPSH